MSKCASRCLVSLASLFYAGASLPGATVDLVAVADGFVQGNSSGLSQLDTVGQRLRASQFGTSKTDTLLEFDLATLPDRAVILGASLVGTSAVFTSNPRNNGIDLTFFGLDGNGIVDLDDATAPGTGMGLATLPSSNGDFHIGLVPLAIQSVLNDDDPNDFFALRAEAANAVRWDLVSLDADQADATSPTLRLTFMVVPEPRVPLGALSAIGMIAHLLRRRSK